ncbi:MAG: aspartyl/asparaginyl beta-hydroxylase domain-containing protein, partial [Proteobacteria bacterium]|nr:aspartyl/asparaginyl beta-hydroxylase domain-containing protein [Pseudomonadota bacterium]
MTQTAAAEAQELLRQGRIDEAQRAFEQVLEQDPDHVEALNVLSLVALRNGSPDRALQMLQRAVAADPSDAMSQHHLGRVQSALGDAQAALLTHRKAVELAPHFHVARLYLAEALERANEPEQAVVQYARALQDAQNAGRWLNADTTPPPLRPMVEQAVVAVRKGRHAAFDRLFEPLSKQYGPDSLGRVRDALAVYMNEARAVPGDPRQAPTFLFFPGLPTTPYFPKTLFTGIEELEANTRLIRGELEGVLGSDAGRERVFNSDELEKQNLRGLKRAPSWNGYYFYRYGERRQDNCAACPVTAASIERLPLSRIREHAPEVLFSVFTPDTHLLPHQGVTNTRVVAHLPLMVPENCALNVGGEDHYWRE